MYYSAGDPAIEADTTRIVNETVKKYGELNILCCCHGYSKPGSILEQATEDWQEMMDANVKGTYLFRNMLQSRWLHRGRAER